MFKGFHTHECATITPGRLPGLSACPARAAAGGGANVCAAPKRYASRLTLHNSASRRVEAHTTPSTQSRRQAGPPLCVCVCVCVCVIQELEKELQGCVCVCVCVCMCVCVCVCVCVEPNVDQVQSLVLGFRA